MPSHANGYTRSYRRKTDAGIAGRQMPWNPSQPAMKSHAIAWSTPVVPIAEAGCVDVDVVDAHVGRLEEQRPAAGCARRDEILDDLVLSVDGDARGRR